jgi:Tol biopolymer transport system component
MNRRASERCAVAALVAVTFYGLACIYPVAWSPDSTGVVFPVLRGETGAPTALVMADLEGNLVREVASVGPQQGALSPAAWSPDGRLLAYLRYDRLEGESVKTSLILHDVESGREEVIWRGPEVTDPKSFMTAILGPVWLSDPLRIVVDEMPPDHRSLLVLSTTGETEATIRLPPTDEEGTWVALSPDGRYVAYPQPAPQAPPDAVTVMLRPAAGGEPRELCQTWTSDVGPFLRPAWARDSGALYLPVLAPTDEDRRTGYVRRYDVASGASRDLWQRPDAQVFGVSLSADGCVMAVDYFVERESPEFLATDVVDLDRGAAATVHYSGDGTMHMYSTVSPDGRWLAFAQGDEEGRGPVGVLVSADGATVRFYLPDEPDAQELAAEVALNRLMLASRFGSEVGQVKNSLDERLAEEGLAGIASAAPAGLLRVRTAVNETLAVDLSPLTRETLRVHLLTELTNGLGARAGTLSVAEAEAMATACRAMLADYEADYPASILLPGLTESLEEALSGLAADAPEETPALTP